MRQKMKTDSKNIVIDVKNIKKSFKKSSSTELLVLDQVNFPIYEGEIVAILGKSGSGKSTLLRIIAGLVEPTTGEIIYNNQPIHRPVPGLTMVFQHFALLPWLTVLENVELGLEAQGVEKSERRQRALKTIDIVGLDGFESAYPKELSGGMSQRVGIARALVVDPEVLLMDEPFSALDVLTAENLRGDLIDIWQSDKTNIKAVILVTHNIEEAVILADRILVFSNEPGSVREEILVDLPRPRNETEPQFRELVDRIYRLMTQPSGAKTPFGDRKFKVIGMGYRLPKVSISEITGLIETLASPDYKARVDLPELAEDLRMEVDDLFPILEALEILRFARVSEGDVQLTPDGRYFDQADMLEKKKIFAAHLMNFVPLARHIRRVLDERPEHSASEQRFITELEDHLSEESAEEVLTTVIDWGRYAELFAYDYNTGILSLENPV